MFITFEGIDGVGKSTQIGFVENYLATLGHNVLVTFEPGGTDLGHEIRQLLLHRKGAVSPRSEALLYAADRAHHIATKIRPALKAGQIVISDRYLDSSVAYQGAGRKLAADEVRNISVWAVDGLLPDLTVLLDLEAGKAAKRRENTGQEPDRLELEKQEFFEAVRSEYLKLAEAEPNRFLVISAEGTPEEIFAQIQAKLDELLA